MYLWVLCVWTLTAVLSARGYPGHHNHQNEKTILFLVDGVRWDYISRDPELKGFPRMAKMGAKAEYVQPIFPSNSYPNWYSIVTGLYAESHGMVQNYMYDIEKNDYFLMSPHPNASNEHWWNKAEPVWITAEKRGINASMYWWDGCQVSIGGVEPSVCVEYQTFWSWLTPLEDTEEALGDILTWFETSPTHRLALVYYEGIDATGHYRGPNSTFTINAMKQIDEVIDKFQDTLEKRNMKDSVNFLVVSDHGMADSDPKITQIIKLEDYNITQDIELMLDRGSLTMILPVEGREEKLYAKLKHANIKGLHVYKKNDLPERYHMKNNDLVLPIVLTADEGFFINKISDVGKMKPSYGGRIFKGYHGYDPDRAYNMRTIFYAIGPSITKGYTSPPIDMVDHYNLICHLLNIKPLPNNGTWEKVEGFVNAQKASLHSAQSISPDDNGAEALSPGDNSASSITSLLWMTQVVILFVLGLPELLVNR